MIKRYFKLRLSLPKYVNSYDSDIILRYLDSLPHSKFMLFELMTKKLCNYCACYVGSPCRIVYLANGTYTLYIDKVSKTPEALREFNSNKKLCVVACLKVYILRAELINENLVNKDQLILSYAYPHKPINCQSTARYMKVFSETSEIDVTVFKAYSTRSSSISKANNVGLCLKDIEKVKVFRGSNTLRKYYNCPLLKKFVE